MKAIATILLGLTLCAPAWAEMNMHTIHEGCELRPKIEASKGQLSLADGFKAGVVSGYITGYAEATPLKHRTPTVGELLDGVCKYTDLHPEIWNLSPAEGMDLVLNALYGEKK
jgi:hypothetical protein